MAKCGIITLTESTINTENFDLLADADGMGNPYLIFETGISRSALVSGFSSSNIPDLATVVRIKSNAACTNYIDISIVAVTPTPTPTPLPLALSIDSTGYPNYATACGFGVDVNPVYLEVGYSLPIPPAHLYTNSIGTIPFIGNSTDWYYITDNTSFYYVVRPDSLGEILEYADCDNLPTPTPTVTPTVTPAVSSTPTPTPTRTVTPTPTRTVTPTPTVTPSESPPPTTTIYITVAGPITYNVSWVKLDTVEIIGVVTPGNTGSAVTSTTGTGTIEVRISASSEAGDSMTCQSGAYFDCQDSPSPSTYYYSVPLNGTDVDIFVDEVGCL